MSMRKFLLLYDAIQYVEEEKNLQMLAALQYVNVEKKKDRKPLERILFPVSHKIKPYLEANDNGEGVKALKLLAKL